MQRRPVAGVSVAMPEAWPSAAPASSPIASYIPMPSAPTSAARFVIAGGTLSLGPRFLSISVQAGEFAGSWPIPNSS